MPYTHAHRSLVPISALALSGLAWILLAQTGRPDQAQLWHHRNLGKAFYENPTTQKQAVDEFKKALDLAPGSVRERVNYGLALLRAGDATRGVEELEKAQKHDPKLPYTWFNLGIAFKKQGDLEKALEQFQGMAKLVPNEPVTHYQLGSILKAQGEQAAAVKEFEAARNLNPRLAAPHFQLYGLYRQLNHPQEAAAELRTFQEIKKQQEGAAVPEDMEWCFYAEIYDPIDGTAPAPPPAPVYRTRTHRDGLRRGVGRGDSADSRWRDAGEPARVVGERDGDLPGGCGERVWRNCARWFSWRRGFRQRRADGSVRGHHHGCGTVPQRERQIPQAGGCGCRRVPPGGLAGFRP